MAPRSLYARLLSLVALIGLVALALAAPALPLSAQEPSPTLPSPGQRLFVPLINRWRIDTWPFIEVPPEVAEIAYVSAFAHQPIGTLGEIYLTSRSRWITHLTKPMDGEVGVYPAHLAWSPDGQWLVYSRTPLGVPLSSDLHLLDFSQGVDAVQPDGIRITASPEVEAWPTFSPAGDEVAFVQVRGTTRTLAIIHVVQAIAGMDPPIRTVETPGCDPLWPAWSPHREWIAFVSGSALYIVRPDGSGLQQVAEGAFAERPAWSPDGGSLAYGSERAEVRRVMVDPASGETLRAVACAGSEPDWSPTGWWIAYSGLTAEGARAIHTVRADGTDARILTGADGGHIDEDPAWSPDGLYLAFRRTLLAPSGGEAAGDSSIQVVRMDGTGLVRVSDLGHRTSLDHAWRPTTR